MIENSGPSKMLRQTNPEVLLPTHRPRPRLHRRGRGFCVPRPGFEPVFTVRHAL